jgi:hypothetical protein
MMKTSQDPKKRLRQTFFQLFPLSYRIKETQPSKEDMNKKLFIEVLIQLKAIEDRRDFMQDEIGMDMTVYENRFFSVIENLMKMYFSKEQLAIIQLYLYQLTPEKDWDGTITIEVGKEEKIVPFSSPMDVWNVIGML